MRRFVFAAVALASASALAGCQTPQQQNAANGAVLGGATGALIGGLASGRAGGALAGGAIGAATGAIIGSAARPAPPPPGYYEPVPTVYAAPPPPPRCVRFGFDPYGNQVCLQFARY
jgi:predicted lipid-binding transport protein (Tim44 family)